jgi:hypothetical protein
MDCFCRVFYPHGPAKTKPDMVSPADKSFSQNSESFLSLLIGVDNRGLLFLVPLFSLYLGHPLTMSVASFN